MLSAWLQNKEFIGWAKSLNAKGVAQEQLLFCWACLTGNIDLTTFMLEKRTAGELNFQPNFNQNFALQQAANYGHFPIVKTLCELSECDPTVNFGYCLNISAEKGFLDIVKYLVELKRENQNGVADFIFNQDHLNNALPKASYAGRENVVEFLAFYRRQDFVCHISAKDHEAIKISSFNHKTKVANILAEAYHLRNLKVPSTVDIVRNLFERSEHLLIGAQLIKLFHQFSLSDEIIEPILEEAFPLSNNSVQICFQLATNKKSNLPVAQMMDQCEGLLAKRIKSTL